MVNFLALLGWSPGAGNEEVFSRDELAARFSLDGIAGGNAVFNPEKLDWFNQQHITRTAPADLAERLHPYLSAEGLWDPELLSTRRPWFERLIRLLQPRVKTLADFAAAMRPFLVETIDRDPAAVAKHLGDAALAPHWQTWRDALSAAASFDPAALESTLRSIATAAGIKPALLIHATRVAIVGQTASPGLFEVLELVGRERVLQRMHEVEPGGAA
jgi:glutamyl/glutaminyl-tRNA synthetase